VVNTRNFVFPHIGHSISNTFKKENELIAEDLDSQIKVYDLITLFKLYKMHCHFCTYVFHLSNFCMLFLFLYATIKKKNVYFDNCFLFIAWKKKDDIEYVIDIKKKGENKAVIEEK